jgi:hypothetical protein
LPELLKQYEIEDYVEKTGVSDYTGYGINTCHFAFTGQTGIFG